MRFMLAWWVWKFKFIGGMIFANKFWKLIHRIQNKYELCHDKSKRKAMNRNWSNQKANPALKTKAGNK